MTTRRFIQLTVISLLFMLSGCSTLSGLGKAQQPTASVTQVSFADISLQAITLNVHVRVHNPNPFAVQGAGLDLHMLINDNRLLSVAQPDNRMTLPARGHTDLILPLTVEYAALYRTASGLRGKNEVPYALQGHVRIDVPVLGEISAPFQFNDTLPIPRLPNVSLDSVQLVETSFSRVRLNVTLNMNNPNRFAIALNQLGFQLNANQRALAQADVGRMSLNGNQQQTVTVPISLSLAELGSALFRLLGSGQAIDFALNGQADVIPDLPGWQPERMHFDSAKKVQW